MIHHRAAALAGALAMLLSARTAGAQDINDIGKKLVALDAEAHTLGQGLAKPHVKGRTADELARDLIDAKVAFGVGNFDAAAVMLYELVEGHRSMVAYDEALYYLAEALFQKGDFVASRSYFTQLVKGIGSRSAYYQQSLQRLVELTLKLEDPAQVETWLNLLDAVPASERRSSVPYVRGKYAYFSGKHDDAIASFAKVTPDSEHYFEALYFIGASNVAKGDLAAAQTAFSNLVKLSPKSTTDRHIVELGHLALARIHYENDEPSQAIDSYLHIPRKSKLFDETLYEAAWVYVKNREFNKALRALELLALSDPTSARMPEVRILEGNLRIRKARELVDTKDGNSLEEYAKALAVFEQTRDAFAEPKKQLDALLASQSDPTALIDQITGEHKDDFAAEASLPEVAVAWLSREPTVHRVIGIEHDIDAVKKEIHVAEGIVTRLDYALSTANRVHAFPKLAERRVRAVEIREDLVSMEAKLAARLTAMVATVTTPAEKAKLAKLAGARESISKRIAALPLQDLSYSERIGKARAQYQALDHKASEVGVVLETTLAEIAALEKYIAQQGVPEADPADLRSVNHEIATLKTDVKGMQTELGDVRRQALLAKDVAGTADASALRAAELRDDLRAAVAAENAFLGTLSARLQGQDRAEADQIASLTAKARSIDSQLATVVSTIDTYVDAALADVRLALAEEKARIAACKQELAGYEAESAALGGEALAASFDDVAKKFEDILVRADVGIVDVAWSQKEAADASQKRLVLDQARERQVLDSNFADVVRHHQKEQAEAKAAKAPAPAPAEGQVAPEEEQAAPAADASGGGAK